MAGKFIVGTGFKVRIADFFAIFVARVEAYYFLLALGRGYADGVAVLAVEISQASDSSAKMDILDVDSLPVFSSLELAGIGMDAFILAGPGDDGQIALKMKRLDKDKNQLKVFRGSRRADKWVSR